MERDSYSFWGLFPVHVLRQAPVLSILARCVRCRPSSANGRHVRHSAHTAKGFLYDRFGGGYPCSSQNRVCRL